MWQCSRVDLPEPAAYLSAALSRVCHYHPYELAPTASELTRWLKETADLVALLRSCPRHGSAI
jgi:hypothetical protein